jgi:hypothetical protein
LDEFEDDSSTGTTPVVCKAQKASYIGTDNEYLCITLAYSSPINERAYTSVTLGFLITEQLGQKIKFVNDQTIEACEVSVACERCPVEDCTLRANEPLAYREKQRINKMLAKLEALGVRQ